MSVLKIKNENNEWIEITTIQGPAGPQGADGPAGEDGYTPIKGTDYFTTADKNEIVGLVKADLTIPSADEVSYDGTITGVENVQNAIDYIHGYAIDETYLNNAGYQTETQVNALISTALGKIGVAEEGVY